MSNKIMNTSELQDYLGVSRDIVRKLLTETDIPYIIIGKRRYFYPPAIDAFLQQATYKK